MPRADMVALQAPRDPVLVCVMGMDHQALLGCRVVFPLFLHLFSLTTLTYRKFWKLTW